MNNNYNEYDVRLYYGLELQNACIRRSETSTSHRRRRKHGE